MDIPDLPMNAFEHIGDRKIKPQGGNPLDSISEVIGTDGGGGGVLGALEDIDPGKEIGKGLAEVDKFVGREIPGGWKTVGLVAASVAAPYAMSALSSAGAAGAGSTAGSFVAADAAGMAASGLSEAAIAQNLAMAGVDSFVAADAAALAASGLSEAAITTNLTYAYGADLASSAASAASAAGGVPVYDKSMAIEQFGPTYQELGVTGVPEGGMGPTYAELGYTGLNPAEFPSVPSSATAGMSTTQKMLMGAQLGRGLLGGQPQQQNPYAQMAQRNTVPGGAVDYSGILNLLSPKSAQRKTSLLG